MLNRLPREVVSTDRAQETFGKHSQERGVIPGESCAGPGVGVMIFGGSLPTHYIL